jgi:hypothetical protein
LIQCITICAFMYARYPFCGKNGIRYDCAYLWPFPGKRQKSEEEITHEAWCAIRVTTMSEL